jgi:hypothetical protein
VTGNKAINAEIDKYESVLIIRLYQPDLFSADKF